MTKREQREICKAVCPGHISRFSEEDRDECRKAQGPCKAFWKLAYEREHKRVDRVKKKVARLELERRLA